MFLELLLKSMEVRLVKEKEKKVAGTLRGFVIGSTPEKNQSFEVNSRGNSHEGVRAVEDDRIELRV